MISRSYAERNPTEVPKTHLTGLEKEILKASSKHFKAQTREELDFWGNILIDLQSNYQKITGHYMSYDGRVLR